MGKSDIKYNEDIINAEGGVFLVQADAGTGKTTHLVERLRRKMSETGCGGEEILCVTFTNAAADEMKERAGLDVDTGTRGPFIGTIHSFCYNFLRNHAETFGEFQMMDSAVMDDIKSELGLKKRLAKDIDFSGVQRYARLSRIADREMSRRMGIDALLPEEPGMRLIFKDIAERYNRLKAEKAVREYDDCLVDTYNILRGNTLPPGFNQFTWIQVDETQDLSPLQLAIIEGLFSREEGSTLMYFGDRKQSIFSYMGATPDSLSEIQVRAKEVFRLRDNHRSSPALIDLFGAYSAKVLEDEDQPCPEPPSVPDPSVCLFHSEEFKEECIDIAGKVRSLRKRDPEKSIGIILRTNEQADEMSCALTDYGLRHVKLSGEDSVRRAAIRVLIAHYRIAIDAKDYSAWKDILYHVGCTETPAEASFVLRLLRKYGLTPADLIDPPKSAGQASAPERTEEQLRLLSRIGIRYVAAKLNANYRSLYLKAQTLLKIDSEHNATERLSKAAEETYNVLLEEGYVENTSLPLRRKRTEAIARATTAFSDTPLVEREKREVLRTEEMTSVFFSYVKEEILAKCSGKTVQEILKEAIPKVLDMDESFLVDRIPENTAVMTVHKAKGQAFDHVFVAGVNSYQYSNEEDARLLYVAITRARQSLTVSYHKLVRRGLRLDRSKHLDLVVPFFTRNADEDAQ